MMHASLSNLLDHFQEDRIYANDTYPNLEMLSLYMYNYYRRRKPYQVATKRLETT